MLELIGAGLVFISIFSAGYAAFLTRKVVKLKRDVAERDDLIDDLRSALGGAEDKADWRNSVL